MLQADYTFFTGARPTFPHGTDELIGCQATRRMHILKNQSADGNTLYLESPETKNTHALQVCKSTEN